MRAFRIVWRRCQAAFPWTKERAAIELLEQQLRELEKLRNSNPEDPKFISWFSVSAVCLDRFVPESPNTAQFKQICFYDNPVADETSISNPFAHGLDIARQHLTSAIEDIKNLGLIAAGGKLQQANSKTNSMWEFIKLILNWFLKFVLGWFVKK